ncbi:anthranilate synthase component I [Rhodothalassium salexigens]|uniref:anthranilate synthase component I n=1 Tax=Rhodothalassium salexigens TaxID=1086 RepID=UPI0019146EA5|nr:anthranilate synthase component I [Rhodothalassium salexigens]MBK5910661.1 anthranilate synthase component I [Rhodothalassium salexigens]MBK5920596.1 anthranilate synthase component I [Rhodothalassium salexigens]
MPVNPTAVAPDRATVVDRYARGQATALHLRLVGDLETPVSAYLKLAVPGQPSFLLESVEGGRVRGRYSIIGTAPDLLWRVRGERAEVNRQPGDDLDRFEADDTPATEREAAPLASLRRLVDRSRLDLPQGLPPMAGGLVGYLGYDTVRWMERLGSVKPDPLGLATSFFMRPRLTAVFDTVTDWLTLVAPVRPTPGLSADDAYDAACAALHAALDRLRGPLPDTRSTGDRDAETTSAPDQSVTERIASNTGPERYHAMVEAAREHIRAGDTFQTVLSQRFSAPFTLPPFALYRAVRRTNPSPFMFFLDLPDGAVVGSSPEILVRLRDGTVTVRPIAGTRPRGADPQADAALAQDLLTDPKELAEHLMLVDLGRNDVGRVADPGSVTVTARNVIERYSHVMHIVSNVEGRIAPDRDAIDALKATFPAGTVSGAPKIRAMEIIDALEAEPRGLYAGAVGYFAADGSMDSCIVLRTAVVKDGMMHVQAGAGIVADSDPASEQQECVNKARALFRAAEEAVRFAGG